MTALSLSLKKIENYAFSCKLVGFVEESVALESKASTVPFKATDAVGDDILYTQYKLPDKAGNFPTGVMAPLLPPGGILGCNALTPKVVYSSPFVMDSELDRNEDRMG